MQETIMVRSIRTAYMILAEVEDLQLGQHEQQRPTAEAPQQHARVPRLMMAPMPSLEDLQQYGHK